MSRVLKIGIGLLGSILAVLLAWELGNSKMARASECQPPTPCPCAADGMCHPNDTWGNYKTRWRPWPGDQVGLTPTKAEETESSILDRLKPYQPPRPEQEDLRGPAKKTPASSAAQPAATDGNPQAEPALNGAEPAGQDIELPGLPGLPGFDPQGFLPPEKLQQLPLIEDGPPALPQSLSAALAVTPYIALPQTQSKSGPTVEANRSRITTIASEDSISTEESHIVRTSAELQQVSSIHLANPAAKNIYKPTDEELHQAIYIETSDTSVKDE